MPLGKPKETSFRIVLLIVLGALVVLSLSASAERIKDLANLAGARPNQLIGYGLVVGLDGTGDQTTQTPFTTQSLQSMLSQLGVNLPPGTNLQLKNVAAVMVTAQLPPFAQPGQTIDVTVSSLGNAKSLRGGTLLMTPLKGADGQIYAMAQGNVVVGGAGASAGGSKMQINHLTAGRIPGGATVERAVPTRARTGRLRAARTARQRLHTARAMVEAINDASGTGSRPRSTAASSGCARRSGTDARVAFLADLREHLAST